MFRKIGGRKKKLISWLEYCQLSAQLPGVKPVELTGVNIDAVKAWRLMDCKLDWAALPAVLVYIGCDDYEIVINSLDQIKTYNEQKQRNG